MGLGPAPGGHDQGHAGDDDRPGQRGPRLDRLAQEQPGQDDGDDRVDVGVGRDLGQRRDPQQPDVGREADQAADRRQVGQAQDRSAGDGRQVEARELAGEQGGDQQERAAADHLEAGRGERPAGQDRPMARVERARRPADRRDSSTSEAERGRRPDRLPASGSDEDRRRRASPTTMPTIDHPRQPLAEEEPAEDGDPDRQHARSGRRRCRRARSARRGRRGPSPPSRSAPPTIAESRTGGRSAGTTARSAGGGRAGSPLRIRRTASHSQTRRSGAGEQEADAGHQERRDRLVGQADADVGRAPHEVEDEHAEPRSRPGPAVALTRPSAPVIGYLAELAGPSVEHTSNAGAARGKSRPAARLIRRPRRPAGMRGRRDSRPRSRPPPTGRAPGGGRVIRFALWQVGRQ